MSPSDIEVLLHYYRSTEEHPRIDAPAVADGLDWMAGEGLVEPREATDRQTASYRVAERGKVLINAWCTQPLPVQVWTLPDRDHT